MYLTFIRICNCRSFKG